MMKLSRKNFVAVFVLIYIIAGPLLIPNAVPALISESSLKSGPYVDKIRYDIITQDDHQVLALQGNEIDLIGGWVDPTFLDTLQEANNIEVTNTLRNGYGYININCEMYPYNITAFRRALAFALDKEYISEDIWDGLSEPLDSCVPKINPWTIEGQLSYSYYDANITTGEHLLDEAGFLDIDSDSYRESPNGDELYVEVAVGYSSNIAMEIGENVAAALDSLNVNATWFPYDFFHYIHPKSLTSWFPIVFYGKSYRGFDVDWLATEFWSEYADNDESVWNLPRFKNSAYDSWREQLLHSASYDEVYEAAIEMQKIWVYECPQIICYENTMLTAHRTDRFEGFVNDAKDGIPSWWSNYRTHLKDKSESPFGGTLRWSTPLDVDTFNFMTTSTYTMDILQMLYDSLLRVGPDGNDIPWLAESYTIEMHEDNPSITEGHTRITFEILQNATWSDGEPLTAEDIAFTLDYYRYSGNSQGSDLSDMVAAYSLTPHTLRVEFDTESYWHLHSVGYKYILPQHIYSEIGKENWNLTDPQPPIETLVTSGPFNISNYVPEEYIELTRNPNYFFDAIPPWEINGSTLQPQNIPVEILVILVGASTAAVVIGIVIWKSKIVVID